MSYAVIRVQKVKGGGGGGGALGRHIDRSFDDELFVPENADSERVKNNIHWDKNGKSYTQDQWVKYTKQNSLSNRINKEIKSRYNGLRKIRKDAVKAFEFIVTSDKIKMDEIFNDKNKYRNWIVENRKFFMEEYTEQNIVSMHLHLDEKTPHMHIVIAPITEDGRLSGKSFINGKKDLANIQTRYAKAMNQFGMSRGSFGSKATHQRPNSTNSKSKSYVR